MHLRRLWPAAVLVLAPVLAACGNDEDGPGGEPPSSSAPPPSSSAPTTSAAPTEASTTPTPTLPATLPACDLITSGDVDKVMGVTFAAGTPDTEDEQEGGVSWSASECSFEAKDLVEVSVRVAGPEAFDDGTVACPMPSDSDGSVEPRDVAGATQAWYKVSPPPNFQGVMRACSNSALVEVDLDYEDGVDYEGDPGDQSARLAAFVLANLQG